MVIDRICLREPPGSHRVVSQPMRGHGRPSPIAIGDAAAVARELHAIRARLVEIEASMGLRSTTLTQDGDGDLLSSSITLKRAAGLWGISYEGARKRCIRLVEIGLAEKRRPGGWRVSPAGLQSGVERGRG